MRQKHFTGKGEPVSYLTTATAPTSASRPLIDAPAGADLLFPEARVEEWKLGKRRCRLWLIPDSEAASVTKRTNIRTSRAAVGSQGFAVGRKWHIWKQYGSVETARNRKLMHPHARTPAASPLWASSQLRLRKVWTPSRLSSTPLAPLRASTLHEVDTKKAFKTF